MMAGCEGTNTSKESQNRNNSNVSSLESTTSSDNTNSSVSSESTASQDNSSSIESAFAVDPLSGDISTETSVIKRRDDAEEVRPSGNTADLLKPMTGGSDLAAETMRQSILSAGNTSDYHKISGKTYYISADGNDLNNGLFPESPMRSITSLNTLALTAGDAVLLERGSIFRLTEPIHAVSGVTYGAYGKGDKPAIYGSPNNYAKKNFWSPTNKKNVWKLEFAYGDTGIVVFNHGEEVGVKKLVGVDQLSTNGNFYHNVNSGMLYLYFDKGNPGTYYKDIEVGPKASIFYLDKGISGVTIDNVCMKYVGEFAVNAVYYNNNITITNCEMGWIGGSKLDASVRYGNAVQFWDSTKNSRVDNCWIYQIFDTALTFQGTTGASYENISFCNNLLEYNDMHIEFWDQGKTYKIINFSLENNIMRFAAFGWGTRDNDAGNRGGATNVKANCNNCSACVISLKNNIFDCSRGTSISWGIPSDPTAKIIISGNSIYESPNRMNNIVIIFGTYVNNIISGKYTVANQADLEKAFKAFDSSPKTIKWLS